MSQIIRKYKPTIELEKMTYPNKEKGLSDELGQTDKAGLLNKAGLSNKATGLLNKTGLSNKLNNDGSDVGNDLYYKKSQLIGNIAPYIIIEKFRFFMSSITYLEIDTSKFLPRIKVTLVDTTGAFTEGYIPKKNPILSLYIKSAHNKLLPIRNDYIITDIISSPDKNHNNSSLNQRTTYTIYGELFVPLIKNFEINSYEGTSLEVIDNIAKSIKLGFATNIESTNDDMIWINTYNNVEYFIKEHLTKYGYIDDNNILNSFIDFYYNLNYVNLYSLLQTDENEKYKTYYTFMKYNDILNEDDDLSKDNSKMSPYVITNCSKFKDTTAYIISYTPVSKQGKVLIKKGNIRKIQYYNNIISDDINEKFLEFNPSPYSNITLNTDNTNLNDINQKIYFEYSGIDYNNTHDNYKFAKILNETGYDELNKIVIKVKLNGLNNSVFKNMLLPVVIININNDAELNQNIYDTQKDSIFKEFYTKYGIIIDKNYTGHYIIKDIKYIYNPSNFNDDIYMTELTLIKTDWEK